MRKAPPHTNVYARDLPSRGVDHGVDRFMLPVHKAAQDLSGIGVIVATWDFLLHDIDGGGDHQQGRRRASNGKGLQGVPAGGVPWPVEEACDG